MRDASWLAGGHPGGRALPLRCDNALDLGSPFGAPARGWNPARSVLCRVLLGAFRNLHDMPPSIPDLEKLLAYSALGDHQAFAAVYDATRRRGWAICLRLLQDRALAEDALQDAYVKVWHQAANYRPTQGAAEAWLATVVRNTCLDKLRALKREPVESMDAMHTPLDPVDGAPGPEQRLERSLSHGSLDRCFEQLKPQQRELLTHSYVMGLSHGELAARTGMALGTIKTIIRRAILALRACLEEGATP